MSGETKGATTVIPGCRHDNVDPNYPRITAPCPDCAAIVDMSVWRKLHPQPEPPKSWVRRNSECYSDPPSAEAASEATVEECARFINDTFGLNVAADILRRAMLEPKE